MVGLAATNITGANQSYFFRGNKTDQEGIKFGPTEFVKEWASLNETGFSQVDTILPIPGHDHRAYFFCADKHARIEYVPGAGGDRIIGGVKRIRDGWPSLVEAGFDHVDAAILVPGRKGEAYICSGKQYARIELIEGEANGKLKYSKTS
ncbi:hemopexin domain protein [Ceratobasidium sp. AG-Ba]|nr:hemopexin domain protein [Ceratobasidium sp. AG-Ba]QRW07195.1 hemopexin domain protein [Ceratobasidium sp. AG-Ba]